MAFPFENLQVYQLSLDWAEQVEQLCKRSKDQLTHSFKDQFQHASLSVPLNIAEGNGRWHSAEKRRVFWIARGSVFECVPLLELLKRKKQIAPEKFQKAQLTTIQSFKVRDVRFLRDPLGFLIP
ncbi:MAG TPA: four helix bundle protein [Pseudobdellovibrionaceae bacterium]|nr:four helix bundle protein [Pseudobdellovibrionaceae bacterium]